VVKIKVGLVVNESWLLVSPVPEHDLLTEMPAVVDADQAAGPPVAPATDGLPVEGG